MPRSCQVTAKADFGGGDTGEVPRFLQMLTHLGKTGSLIFSLILYFSWYISTMLRIVLAVTFWFLKLIQGQHCHLSSVAGVDSSAGS